MATTLLLARHGETDANRERRWQGQTETALNDNGREQARRLALELAAEPPDAIFCSDLDRARETAEIVGAELSREVELEPRLREVDVGKLAGRSVAVMPGDWARPLDYLLAEQPTLFEEMRSRVLDALLGGPIAAAWLACGGEVADRPSVGNCHVQRIRVEGRTMARID
jgi:broad specificity phosphatase PhoE